MTRQPSRRRATRDRTASAAARRRAWTALGCVLAVLALIAASLPQPGAWALGGDVPGKSLAVAQAWEPASPLADADTPIVAAPPVPAAPPAGTARTRPGRGAAFVETFRAPPLERPPRPSV